MMGNIGASFYRANEEKCPNCGAFGNEEDDHQHCPACDTRFTRYLVLEQGDDRELRNN